MPILRYVTWVGTALLALFWLADWQQPKPLPKPADDPIRPVIRITSIQQLPERIIIDTSQPTIVPPPTLFTDAAPSEPSPTPKSYAEAAPPPAVSKVDQKKRKVVKRQEPKVADKPAVLASAAAGSSGSPVTMAPPTRLSFADIISGQLVKNLLNLN